MIRSCGAAVVVAMLAAACSDSRDGTSRPPPTVSAERVAPADVSFPVDAEGRQLVLHGVNVESAAKTRAAGHLPTSTPEEVAVARTGLGLNTVRFLIFWAAVEPRPGVYDEAYLDRVQAWLDGFATRHVHVILDMHQDLYSERTGADGAPDWAVITDGLTYQPPAADQPWYLGAADPATQAAYRNFWDPERGHPELRQHYAAMWQHVARRFKGHPAVVGYDLMNEPGFANGTLDETLAIAPKAEAGEFHNPRLTEFFQDNIDAIRTVDRDVWLFVEPTSLLTPFAYAGDLLPLTDPRSGPPHLGYAPHLYEPGLDGGGGYTDRGYVGRWEGHRVAEAAALRGPLLIGEFGTSAEQAGVDAFLNDVLSMADRNTAGWTYWSFDPGSWSLLADGRSTAIGDVLARVYPDAVAGTIDRFGFDPTTAVFQMSYTDRAGVTGTTDLIVPTHRYPDGFEVRVATADDRWETDPSTQFVRITGGSGPSHAVCIAPKGVACDPAAPLS